MQSPVGRTPKNVQSNGWMFTINNYTPADEARVKQGLRTLGTNRMRYLCVGYEIAPSTGTPHLQGYMYMENKCVLSLARTLCLRGSFMPAEGSAQDNRAYCSKTRFQDPVPNAEFLEWGEMPKQGRRKDLECIAARAHTAGVTMDDLAEQDPNACMRYFNGLQKLNQLAQKPRDPSTTKEVYVYWGPTGTGKSYTMHSMLRTLYGDKPGFFVWNPSMHAWFDGLLPTHGGLGLDEFRGQIPYDQMFGIMDRYACKLQVKGGSVQLIADTIVITSPIHPKDWYAGTSSHSKDKIWEQLARRITKIEHFKEHREACDCRTCKEKRGEPATHFGVSEFLATAEPSASATGGLYVRVPGPDSDTE